MPTGCLNRFTTRRGTTQSTLSLSLLLDLFLFGRVLEHDPSAPVPSLRVFQRAEARGVQGTGPPCKSILYVLDGLTRAGGVFWGGDLEVPPTCAYLIRCLRPGHRKGFLLYHSLYTVLQVQNLFFISPRLADMDQQPAARTTTPSTLCAYCNLLENVEPGSAYGHAFWLAGWKAQTLLVSPKHRPLRNSLPLLTTRASKEFLWRHTCRAAPQSPPKHGRFCA